MSSSPNSADNPSTTPRRRWCRSASRCASPRIAGPIRRCRKGASWRRSRGPGSVTRRPRAIRVWLSAGARAPVVPDLIGSSERAAIIRLQGDGLNLTRTVEIRSADYPADTVIAQWPPAKVKAADVVLLVNRSERGATYVMPDVIGLDGTRAADLLRGWGFRASVVGTYPYPGIAPNIVLRQSPRAGFQVAPGDAISLEVSR